MAVMSPTPRDDWNRLRADTIDAVDLLAAQLRQESSTQDMLDVYLYAKRLLAESMQAFVRIEYSQRCETFHDLRQQLKKEMDDRFEDVIPAEYLTVPYGSRVHEELFSMLLQRKRRAVPGEMLRVITADAVHAERRVRELRELGLDIIPGKTDGANVYRLNSLEIDTSKIPTIIKNVARDKKYVSMPELELIRVLREHTER